MDAQQGETKTMATQILKPGLLVSLKTTIRGGITYKREDYGTRVDADREISAWETTRTIANREEYARAVKVRGAAVQTIRRVCSVTSFGLLCPTGEIQALDAAIVGARALADAFNSGAIHSRIDVYVMRGEIVDSEGEATRAIAAEIADLLAQMEAGIGRLDVKSVRDACNKAREISTALEATGRAPVQRAIDAARRAARQIAKRVEKRGERAGAVLRSLRLDPIMAARFAFVAISNEEPDPQAAEAIVKALADPAEPERRAPGVTLARFSAIDLD
jgi:hypothetical protein